MKLTAILLSAPFAALFAAFAGAPALPAFALAVSAFVLAIAIDGYRDHPGGYGGARAMRRSRVIRTTRHRRLPLAA
jgi:hypothetical protein